MMRRWFARLSVSQMYIKPLVLSVAAHGVLLGILALYYVDTAIAKVRAVVISELEELKEEQEVPEEMLKDEEIDLNAPVSLVSGGSGNVSEAAQEAVAIAPTTSAQSSQATAVLSNPSFLRPLTSGPKGMSLDSTVHGLMGGFAEATGEGGLGSIEQMTQEILRELEKGKVIVAWLLDASRSIADRREAIAQRLDRIYKELDGLGVRENEAMVTAVVSFGKETKFLLPKNGAPTSDIPTLQKAFRAVENDESGEENVAKALVDTANKYRGVQTSGRRSLLLIVVTDEIGDDPERVDEATALLKRNRVPVYALGPMATFNRHVIPFTWTDFETKERFDIPVERGPCTRAMEKLLVLWNDNAYRSGFGSFMLANLALETGGTYFIYDDSRIRGIKYDHDMLLRYKPSFDPKGDYEKEIMTSQYRRTLITMIKEGNPLYARPDGRFYVENWKSGIDGARALVAPFNKFAERWIPVMLETDKLRDSEKSPRWRANFELSLARLIQTKVRCDSWLWAYDRFKEQPKEWVQPSSGNADEDTKRKADPKKWIPSYGPQPMPEVWVGLKAEPAPPPAKAAAAPAGKAPAPQEAPAKEKPKAASKGGADDLDRYEKTRQMADQAKAYFRRVIDEHAGTAWGEAARVEINVPMGFRMISTFIHHDPERNAVRAKVKVPKF